jgi:hypothetical protein
MDWDSKTVEQKIIYDYDRYEQEKTILMRSGVNLRRVLLLLVIFQIVKEYLVSDHQIINEKHLYGYIM